MEATILEIIKEFKDTIEEDGVAWGDFRLPKGRSMIDEFGFDFVPTHGINKVQAENILFYTAQSNGKMLPELLAAHGI